MPYFRHSISDCKYSPVFCVRYKRNIQPENRTRTGKNNKGDGACQRKHGQTQGRGKNPDLKAYRIGEAWPSPETKNNYYTENPQSGYSEGSDETDVLRPEEPAEAQTDILRPEEPIEAQTDILSQPVDNTEAETGVLEAAETSILSQNMIDAPPADPNHNNVKKVGFKIVKKVVLVHTNEFI